MTCLMLHSFDSSSLQCKTPLHLLRLTKKLVCPLSDKNITVADHTRRLREARDIWNTVFTMLLNAPLLLVFRTLILAIPQFPGISSVKSAPSYPIGAYQARPFLTPSNSNFGPNIEGLTATPSGKIYAVDYETVDSLGQVYPTQSLLYRDKLSTTKFNGLYFTDEHSAFAVDQNNTRILRIGLNSAGQVISSRVACFQPSMLPPNDVVVSAKSGLLFISAMNWRQTTDNTDGEIWVCDKTGRMTRVEVMGRVNGIELSPDEKTLYATEGFTRDWVHVSQKIWQYDVDVVKGTISNKRIFVDFSKVPGDSVTVDLDGLKCDDKGNLLAVRYGGSQVAVFSAKDGSLNARIGLTFLNPTNLELDNRGMLYVCGRCTGGEGMMGCVDRLEWPVQAAAGGGGHGAQAKPYGYL